MPLRLAPMGRPRSSKVTIKLWNLRMESHSKPFLVMQIQWSIAFRPDGQTLASSSSDTIKLWNLRNGEVLQTLSGHLDWVSVAFSPDRPLLQADRTISCDLRMGFYVRSLVIQMLLELLPSVLMKRPSQLGKDKKCGISIMESYYALYLDTQTWFLLSLSAPMGRP